MLDTAEYGTALRKRRGLRRNLRSITLPERHVLLAAMLGCVRKTHRGHSTGPGRASVGSGSTIPRRKRYPKAKLVGYNTTVLNRFNGLDFKRATPFDTL